MALLPAFLIGAAFAVLAGVTWRRARRLRVPALDQLVGVFLLIGVIALIVPLLEVTEAAILPIMGGLMLYPVALLRFVDEVAPVRRMIVHIVVAAAGLGLLILVAYLLVGEGSAVVRGVSELEIMVLLPAVVVLVHVVAWRAVGDQARRLRSAYTMRRAWGLNIGLAGLGLGIVFGFRAGEVVAYSFALLAAVVLLIATAPSRGVRAAWLLPDLDTVGAAERHYLGRPDDPGALDGYLHAVNQVVDGHATWLLRGGEMVAAVGDEPPPNLRMGQPRDGHLEVDRLPDGRWLLQSRARDIVLRVLAPEDPVVFGLNESTVLERVTGRLAVALEREQYEEEHRQVALLMQEADYLRRMADLKDDVLSTLSHELRTPLTVIGGSATLLVERWDQLPEAGRRTFVERIEAHAATLTGTIEDTLRLANLRAGEVVVRPQRVGVRELLADLVASIDGGDRVAVDVPEATADLDGELVGDVVRRLTTNALTHSTDGVRITCDVEGTDLTVRVRDSGPGFGDIDERELFTPFNRGGDVLRRETRGMGMGLAVVAATAEAMDATVEIEETSSDGSTILFKLPDCVVPTRQTVD